MTAQVVNNYVMQLPIIHDILVWLLLLTLGVLWFPRPDRHGPWLRLRDPETGRWWAVCPRCGERISTTGEEVWRFRYE